MTYDNIKIHKKQHFALSSEHTFFEKPMQGEGGGGGGVKLTLPPAVLGWI